jgi:hypothetical protein
MFIRVLAWVQKASDQATIPQGQHHTRERNSLDSLFHLQKPVTQKSTDFSQGFLSTDNFTLLVGVRLVSFLSHD